MFKKAMAVLLSCVTAASVFCSCGKDVDLDKDKDTNASAEVEGVANFIAPEIGDTIIKMKIKDYGEVKIRLFPEYADKGVENFVELAKKGYYDGLTFHRVIKDFMIQGGDPLGTGMGGESIWGSKFDGGTNEHLIHATGAVAYANSNGPETNGSQFYIVTGELFTENDLANLGARGLYFSEYQKEIYTTVGGTPWLDGGYTVFGQVYDGLDIIFRIQNVTTDANNDMPMEPVIIESVTVGEYNGEEIRWYISDYDYKEPETTMPETKPNAVVDNNSVENLTAPELGETVVSMKIKGYDGEIKIKLFPEYAEKGVENFVELAKSGYYDGLIFHRVINNFMIQGGDPLGNGTGGECIWGEKFEGGTDDHLIHAAGAIAYANSGSTATNGSQFYIVTGEVYTDDEIDTLISNGYYFSEDEKDIYTTNGGTPWLDGSYTVFGQVYDGLDIVFDIQKTETDAMDKPVEDVVIESVTVTEYGGEEIRWLISDYE